MHIQKIISGSEEIPASDEAKNTISIKRGICSGHELLEESSLEIREKIRIVFVLAHPDDEASHLISLQLFRELGFQVSVEWLTNGDGSTSPDVKKMESIKVLKEIGINDFHFMDNSVHDVIKNIFRADPETRDKKLEELFYQVRKSIQSADIVITNAFEGGHILHDLTNLIVRTAADSEAQTVLEIPQYSLKTLKEMAKSFFRACIHRCLGKKIFYNVGSFRDETDAGELSIPTRSGENLSFPKRIILNDAGVTNKGAHFASYRSQWEDVFAPFLDVVEFNGTETIEAFRKAGKVPSMWSTTMHLEKWILSLFSNIISPKKIYLVMKALTALKEKIKASEEQFPKGHLSHSQRVV